MVIAVSKFPTKRLLFFLVAATTLSLALIPWEQVRSAIGEDLIWRAASAANRHNRVECDFYWSLSQQIAGHEIKDPMLGSAVLGYALNCGAAQYNSERDVAFKHFLSWMLCRDDVSRYAKVMTFHRGAISYSGFGENKVAERLLMRFYRLSKVCEEPDLLATAANNLAVQEYALGKTAAAESLLHEAVTSAPKSLRIKNNLVDLLIRKGCSAEALPIALSALKCEVATANREDVVD